MFFKRKLLERRATLYLNEINCILFLKCRENIMKNLLLII